ncbi:hypothetical protein Brsp01_33260 [Brucella sp. NBRC 12950]|nr:hypothetical protein [Brucella sp. NBRC 12950]GLU28093.1 hypothetical protein Brsp01_33260 [Brucella sp. NBRC 12950]
MADFEIHLDLHGRTSPIGLARSNRVRGAETIMFEYDRAWLENPDRFSLEPALALSRGAFAPPAGLATFGSIGDSAPDAWGRRLMQRSERRMAERDGRSVRTLAESDYLLGVADETRLGAPYSYVTTRQSLSAFGMERLRELPNIEALEDAGLLSRVLMERVDSDSDGDDSLQMTITGSFVP